MQASQPLWLQMVLAGIGPVVTVVLGTLAVGGAVSWIQRRRDARTALHNLTVDMFRIAFGFYVSVEEDRRSREYGEPEQLTDELDALYRQFRVDARTIESRLRVAEHRKTGDRARWVWHSVLDLLTCLYFDHRHSKERLHGLLEGQQREHKRTSQGEEIPRDIADRHLAPHVLTADDIAEGKTFADVVKEKFADAMDELVLLAQ